MKEALKLALEALEKLTNAAEGFSVSGVYFNEELWARKCLDDAYDAMGFAQEALAQPEQDGNVCARCGGIVFDPVLAQPEPKCVAVVEVFGKDWRLDFMSLPVGKHKLYAQQYTYTAPTQQKPFGWKLVPIEPTNEMLKAMDECSTEGYDERLLAGHASSVYMAAVDVAPTPPQHTWVEVEQVKWEGDKLLAKLKENT